MLYILHLAGAGHHDYREWLVPFGSQFVWKGVQLLGNEDLTQWSRDTPSGVSLTSEAFADRTIYFSKEFPGRDDKRLILYDALTLSRLYRIEYLGIASKL